MTLSGRETMLMWATLAMLLIGVTWLLGGPKWKEWEELEVARQSLEEQIVLSERLIGQQASWDERLAASMGDLKVYPAGVDVTPKLLETVEQMARDTSLKLSSLSPSKEQNLGDVSEVAIKCSFEGTLDALVRFLYALKTADGLYKIRSLNMNPTGKGGMLKGLFTVDCAYARGALPVGNNLQVEPIPAP